MKNLRNRITLLVIIMILSLALPVAALNFSPEDSFFTLRRVTQATSGKRDSEEPDISADGSHIVFRSDSDLLDQGIDRNQREIWLYTTITKSLTRVTFSSDPSWRSELPSINVDGSKVAFMSDGDFNNEGLTVGQKEIWLYEKGMPDLKRLTLAPPSDPANPRISSDPSINADGTRIAFESDADFKGEGVPLGQTEIWLYDTAVPTPTLALQRLTYSGAGKNSSNPSISPDGTKIVFQSTSIFTDTVPVGDEEIWLYDTTTAGLTRITVASTSSRKSQDPDFSADGTKITFESDSDLLQTGISFGKEIWLYDLLTSTFTRVTDSGDGRSSSDPSVNGDGSRIAFESDADFLNQGVPSGQKETWLYDKTTNSLKRLTISNDPGQDSVNPRISGLGDLVTFGSDADLKHDGSIPNNQNEVWLAVETEVVGQVYLPIILAK